MSVGSFGSEFFKSDIYSCQTTRMHQSELLDNN